MVNSRVKLSLSLTGKFFFGVCLLFFLKLSFLGNSLFDLARFVVICLGRDNRQKLELPLYAAFYNELLRLYNEDGKTPNFTYEQVFKNRKIT